LVSAGVYEEKFHEPSQATQHDLVAAMAIRGAPRDATSGMLQMREQINSDSLVLLDLPEVILSLHS
jgi:hypothetical protein